MYICVRIRSGDQSGLKKGPEWRRRRGRSCPRRCRRSRPRGWRSSASATWARASGWSVSSWSSRATNSPAAIARASLEAATMPPLPLRELDPDARVARRRPRQHLAHVRLLRAVVDAGTAPSRRSSGARTERSILPQDAGRRLVDRRQDREAGHDGLSAAAPEPAQEQPRAVSPTAGDPGLERVLRRRPAALGPVFDCREPALGDAEFGVLADQQVAQPEDLLLAAVDLRRQLGAGLDRLLLQLGQICFWAASSGLAQLVGLAGAAATRSGRSGARVSVSGSSLRE